jgi:ligand-binding SRPBCC domain-containing protein
MVRGAFKTFCHDHYFESAGSQTTMRDRMVFESPLGLLGRLVGGVLEQHLRSLLDRRNRCIKKTAESEEWRKFLPEDFVSPVKT